MLEHSPLWINHLNNMQQTIQRVVPLSLEKVEIPCLDLATGQRKQGPAYTRNLANAMHGLDSVRAIDLGDVKPESRLATLRAALGNMKGHLDGASGLKKKGVLFTTMSDKGVVETYFSGGKRITHGSILFSECRAMFSMPSLSYRVEADDFPGLGDCHGMISHSLYQELSQHYPIQDGAIQFRFGVKDMWVAKGTLAPYPDWFMKGCDLVLPDSCFKGKCPSLGETQTHDTFFGILHPSKKLRYSSSHQIIHCFESALAQEHILGLARTAMDELLDVRRDYPTFCQRMLDLADAAEDEMPVLRIGAADVHRQLWNHPTLQKTVNELFRRKLVEIGTGKFITGSGLMALPCHNLKPGYVISTDLSSGQYIAARFPVRHYGDIRLNTLINPNDFIGDDGTLVNDPAIRKAFTGGFSKLSREMRYLLEHMPAGTFLFNPDYGLEIGMDSDGDVCSFFSAEGHQPLVDEIKSWLPLASIPKPEKRPHGKDLAEVAVDATNNQVALLAWMMSTCRFYHLVDEYGYLGEQIQLVVDSLKSDTGVDHKYLDTLLKRLSGLIKIDKDAHGVLPWVKYYKKRWLFSSPEHLPPIHEAYMGDTITQLLAQTKEQYQSEFEGQCAFERGLNEQFTFLFSPADIHVTEKTMERCQGYWKQYASDISTVIAAYPPEDKRTDLQQEQFDTAIGDALDKWSDWAANLQETLNVEQLMSIAAGFWRIVHKRGATSSAGFIFRCFTRQVVSRLENYHGTSFRCSRNVGNGVEYEGSPMLCVILPTDKGLGLYEVHADNTTSLVAGVFRDNLTIPCPHIPFPAFLTTRKNHLEVEII